MNFLETIPTLRQISSPLTDSQLAPLDPRCQVVQFCAPLTDQEHIKLARFLELYPQIALRVYGHGIANVSFLKHYPNHPRVQIEIYRLESIDGFECLSENLESFSLTQTATKKLSLGFLKRFAHLKELALESQNKNIEVLSSLSSLEQLTLRSITLPDLKILLPLKNLWALDLKLGGTRDLHLLPQIGALKYLELWRIKGLQEVNMISKTSTLQNLYLEQLKHVTQLPSFKNLDSLRRVTLNNMNGLADLTAVADAPNLEELTVYSSGGLKPADFKPFVHHPTLKFATIGLTNSRNSEQAMKLINLPKCKHVKGGFVYR